MTWHKVTGKTPKHISSSVKTRHESIQKNHFLEKKKRSGIKRSNRLNHFNQTQIFNPFLSFPFNHFTNLHKNKIKQQTFRPTPSKTLHISSISTISTTNWSKASIWLRSWSLSRSYLANNSSRSFVFCRAEARRTACSLAPGTDEDDSTGWGAFGRW